MALIASFELESQEQKSVHFDYKKIRILILTKKNSEYGTEVNFKSGLNNTANFLAEELNQNLGVTTYFTTCVDGNGVDKEIHDFKPTHVILEAIWVTPEKLTELQSLYPKVIFTVRVHSKVTFLAYEGMAVEWIRKYSLLNNVYVSFNAFETFEDFGVIVEPKKLVWLPNIYKKIDYDKITMFQSVMNFFKKPFHGTSYEFNVACFGAIRPMKDILLQAMAAMKYSDQKKLKLLFHINTGRVEQKGDSTLRNLRALFVNTKHVLVEHDWLSHKDLTELIKKIDLGMQVSLNESFNVVTADYVYGFRPIVVSEQIHWVSKLCQCDSNIDSIVSTIHRVINDANLIKENLHKLHQYNERSLEEWRRWVVETVIF
jgi:hypothetical protein